MCHFFDLELLALQRGFIVGYLGVQLRLDVDVTRG